MSAIDRPTWGFKNIATNATTVVKATSGTLHSIVVNKAVASATIGIYDNPSTNSNPIGVITFAGTLVSDPPLLAIYDIDFLTGLTIVTSGATDITVTYR